MAAADSTSWLADIEKSHQFYLLIFSLYVVALGLARLRGKSAWRAHEVVKRDKKKLPVAAFGSSGNSDESFTWNTLYQSGLIGVLLVAILLMYVVLMLVFFHGPAVYTGRAQEVLGSITILLFFPILGIPFFTFMLTSEKHDREFFQDASVTIGIIALSVLAAIAAPFFSDKALAVAIQCAALITLSLCLSYTIGALEGISAADPARRSA